MDKTKIQLDKDVANELIRMKEVGDNYSDVIRRLLKNTKECPKRAGKRGMQK